MGDESNEFHRGSTSQSNGTSISNPADCLDVRVAMEIILRILHKEAFGVAFDYSKK